MNNQTDAHVVGELHKGNQQSLTAIYLEYYEGLCFFAERLLMNREEAEDIVVESFVKLWHFRTNFATMQRIRYFLYITTRNACLNYIKKSENRLKQELKIAPLLPTMQDHVLTEITRAEFNRQVFTAIENLPPQCRLIILMSFVAGFRNEEIADHLRISPNTVKNQRRRGIILMRKTLAKMGALTILWLCLQNEWYKTI